MWNVWYVVIAAALIVIAGIVWHKIDYYAGTPSLLWFIGGIALFISIFVVFISPLSARQQIRQFEYTKQMVYEAVENGTESQNYAVTASVIEMNNWLAATKAQRDTIGNWSVYSTGEIGESFDALTPITLNSEKGGG